MTHTPNTIQLEETHMKPYRPIKQIQVQSQANANVQAIASLEETTASKNKAKHDHNDIPSGLLGWVKDYQALRKTGNVKDAKKLRDRIEREIKSKKLNASKVWGKALEETTASVETAAAPRKKPPRGSHQKQSAMKAGADVKSNVPDSVQNDIYGFLREGLDNDGLPIKWIEAAGKGYEYQCIVELGRKVLGAGTLESITDASSTSIVGYTIQISKGNLILVLNVTTSDAD